MSEGVKRTASPEWIQMLVNMDKDAEHVRKCAACRYNHERAVEVTERARGNYRLAAAIWDAREIQWRAWRSVNYAKNHLLPRPEGLEEQFTFWMTMRPCCGPCRQSQARAQKAAKRAGANEAFAPHLFEAYEHRGRAEAHLRELRREVHGYRTRRAS
jgi:hypothetical protein